MTERSPRARAYQTQRERSVGDVTLRLTRHRSVGEDLPRRYFINQRGETIHVCRIEGGAVIAAAHQFMTRLSVVPTDSERQQVIPPQNHPLSNDTRVTSLACGRFICKRFVGIFLTGSARKKKNRTKKTTAVCCMVTIGGRGRGRTPGSDWTSLVAVAVRAC